jgi:hypothetical protein
MSVLPTELGGCEVFEEHDLLADFGEETGVCGKGFERVLVVVDLLTGDEEEVYTMRLLALRSNLCRVPAVPRLWILVVDHNKVVIILDYPLLWIRLWALDVYTQPVAGIPTLYNILRFLEYAGRISGRYSGRLRFLRLRRHEFCDCRELRSRAAWSGRLAERTGVGSFL